MPILLARKIQLFAAIGGASIVIGYCDMKYAANDIALHAGDAIAAEVLDH